jgi:GTPase Era involved in 16S rRNA processing
VQQELLLPKDSQARVAVGRGGAVAREIAASAQTRLARALGKTVRLSIRVARQKSQVSQFD